MFKHVRTCKKEHVNSMLRTWLSKIMKQYSGKFIFT